MSNEQNLNLTARIEAKKDDRDTEERDRIREKQDENFAEMSRLLAQHRDNAKKLSESFIRLKETLKQ